MPFHLDECMNEDDHLSARYEFSEFIDTGSVLDFSVEKVILDLSDPMRKIVYRAFPNASRISDRL